MPGNAQATRLVDNEKVTVWEYRFKPGENTGWHRHGHDYVVVPLMDGQLRIDSATGSVVSAMESGAAYFRPKGVEHDVINAGEGDYAFIEIELK